MNYLFLVAFIFTSYCAQAQNFSGNYNQIINIDDGGVIVYELTLNPAGRFEFHFYRKLICKICKEENQYGKGTWRQEGKYIFFTTESTDLNENYTLDFTNSKARFHKSETNLLFTKSNISWIEKKQLAKL